MDQDAIDSSYSSSGCPVFGLVWPAMCGPGFGGC
jgi:hypothetical protein